MKRYVPVIIALIMLSLMPALSKAASFSQMVGDDDNFGGAPGTMDSRSLEEQNATNGSQYTDGIGQTVNHQYGFIFDFNVPITNITHAILEANVFDVEENDSVDLQINIEGYDVPGAFDDVFLTNTSNVISFDLLSSLGVSALENICADGLITVDFINVGTGDGYAIDYIALSIENGVPSTSTSTSPAVSTTTTTTPSATTTSTTSVGSSTTSTTVSPAGFTLSGNVTGIIGSNVPIVMTGASSKTVYTDFTRYYEFPNLIPGYYIITPMLEGYVFDPPSREIPNLTGDLSGMDFVSRKAPPCAAEKIYEPGSNQLFILRFLRDNVLSKTPEGREIIKLYYQWSPVIVKAMEDDDEFKEEVKEMIEVLLPLMNEAGK